MLEQDYLMRLIYQLGQAIAHAMVVAGKSKRDDDDEPTQPDPLGAAEMLEVAFGECIGMDQNTLLMLAPESFAGILSVSGVDPQLVPHLVHCLSTEAEFLREAGLPERAELREAQAAALDDAYAN